MPLVPLAATIGAPLVWLVLLQTSYVLAYPACRHQSNWWIYGPGAVAALAAIALVWVAWAATRRGSPTGASRFLADIGLLSAALFVLVVGATLLPPLFLLPCD